MLVNKMRLHGCYEIKLVSRRLYTGLPRRWRWVDGIDFLSSVDWRRMPLILSHCQRNGLSEWGWLSRRPICLMEEQEKPLATPTLPRPQILCLGVWNALCDAELSLSALCYYHLAFCDLLEKRYGCGVWNQLLNAFPLQVRDKPIRGPIKRPQTNCRAKNTSNSQRNVFVRERAQKILKVHRKVLKHK